MTERKTERERETERQRDRETERQRQRLTETDRDRKKIQNHFDKTNQSSVYQSNILNQNASNTDQQEQS